jgi:hypothetical protein
MDTGVSEHFSYFDATGAPGGLSRIQYDVIFASDRHAGLQLGINGKRGKQQQTENKTTDHDNSLEKNKANNSMMLSAC